MIVFVDELMNTPDIAIREIDTLAGMKAVEGLQRDVWGVADLEIIPAYFLKVARDTGGMLIGAYDGTTLIGFVFGILARDAGTITLHSDMLAIQPAYRDHQLGYRLKLAQRDWCLDHDIRCVTWTFDPLQARNARLNFGKLGATSEDYRINYYGETTSVLHQLGTDRFWLRWWLQSEGVRARLAGQAPELPTHYEPAHARVYCDARQSPRVNPVAFSASVLIEIPGDINALQEADRALAVRWREVTRQAFTEAMQAGYRVEDFYRVQRNEQRIGVYELRDDRPGRRC